MTWLERKRIGELATSLKKRSVPQVPAELLSEGIARGVEFVDQQNTAIGLSPYARERKSHVSAGEANKPLPREVESGLGVTQRRGRMHLTFDFLAGIFWLMVGVQANFLLTGLRKLGVEQRPTWLLNAAGVGDGQRRHSESIEVIHHEKRDFWMVGPHGQLTLPRDDDVDVEVETRRRLQHAGNYAGEENLSDSLYRWWREGGWFGDVDGSGDYRARKMDDDLTSVISMSTNASTTDDELDDTGRRTPAQNNPFADRSREATPVAHDAGLDMSLLSRLLDPKTSTDRDEARMLSHSLASNRPTTRSQYRRIQNHSRAQLLSGLRGPAAEMSEEEEERDLEQFILAQRQAAKAKAVTGGTWESGAEGMGAGGPQCVVCQSTPRTILMWPCGCLSMCDECRMGLAARNHTKCICCRTDIAAYSRLYVP